MTETTASDLSPISAEELSRHDRGDAVANRLRSAIRDGSLRAGQRLTETALAEQLGVSRTPIRQALERLISEGLLSAAAGRGIVVTELTRDQVLQIYAFREVLEGAAAGFAARQASQGDLASITNLMARADNQSRDSHALSLLNRDFHHAIYVAAHNEYLIQSGNKLAEFIFLLPGTTYEAPGRREEAQVEHRAIVTAIEKGNAAAAEKLARAHIRRALEIRLELLYGGSP